MHYVADLDLAPFEPRSRLRWLAVIPIVALTFAGLAPPAQAGDSGGARDLVPSVAGAP